MSENKTNQKNDLTELNKDIKNLGIKILKAKLEINKGEQSYANEKLVLVNQIAMEKDGEKPMYSNDVKRQARFQELMITGHPLQTLKAQLEDDKTIVELNIIELEFLKREFDILMKFGGI